MGIEPTLSAWKAEVLPLNYIRMFGGGRWIRTTESSANGFTVRPLWPLGNSSENKMELVKGIEPPTC